jgi:hypothetical protein
VALENPDEVQHPPSAKPSAGGKAGAKISSRDAAGVGVGVAMRKIIGFALIALGVKSIFLIADPNPQFFLGDSASYLHTALTGWIPLDRSYFYGFLIRWITWSSQSLFSVVYVQVLASAVSAGILGWFLLRFLRTGNWIAILGVILYALDPVQLLYERFVMAETFSLLAAILFITLIFCYLERGNYLHLMLASLAGIGAVALRVSFLPPILTLSFAAPFIRYGCLWFDDHQSPKTFLRPFIVALGAITIAHFTFHTAYKRLTGALTNQPPAYQYASGLFLLCAWSPLLVADDLRASGFSTETLAGTATRTLENRRVQRWMSNGLVAALEEKYGDALQANAVAAKVSLHILKRDPVGVVRLTVSTYFRGWETQVIHRCIAEDVGSRPIPPGLVKVAAKHFHLVASDMERQNTVTKNYFRRGLVWYRVLLLTPFLLLFTVAFSDRINRPFLIAAALFAAVVLLTANAISVDNSIRYLHPLGWSFFLLLGFWVRFAAARLRRDYSDMNNRGLTP